MPKTFKQIVEELLPNGHSPAALRYAIHEIAAELDRRAEPPGAIPVEDVDMYVTDW